MSAQRNSAARVGDLERKIAEQEEQIRALSERLSLHGNALIAHSSKVAELTDALMAAFAYAGREYPEPKRPRRLRAVPSPGDGADGAA